MGTNVLTPTTVACKRSPTRLKNSGMNMKLFHQTLVVRVHIVIGLFHKMPLGMGLEGG